MRGLRKRERDSRVVTCWYAVRGPRGADYKMLIDGSPNVLLIGPYDPQCGEYTFLAPPLGVWRLAGVLSAAGFTAQVFDPNCCGGPPQHALERELRSGRWDVVGVSTTGMTLRYDLELAHLVRRAFAPASPPLPLPAKAPTEDPPSLNFKLGLIAATPNEYSR